jgi:hypothetical protein
MAWTATAREARLCQSLQALRILHHVWNLPRFASSRRSNNTIALVPIFPLLQLLITLNISFREHHPPVQLLIYKFDHMCSAPACCIRPMAALAIVVAPCRLTLGSTTTLGSWALLLPALVDLGIASATGIGIMSMQSGRGRWRRLPQQKAAESLSWAAWNQEWWESRCAAVAPTKLEHAKIDGGNARSAWFLSQDLLPFLCQNWSLDWI